MAFSDDKFLSENQCEICGAELSDEVVIQEFADGSIARLCAECAAGAALRSDATQNDGGFRFPEEDADTSYSEGYAFAAVPAAEDAPGGTEGASDLTIETVSAAAPQLGVQPQPGIDPELLEKTRELLTPVVDLLALQRDMQGALQRLAASLQNFATEVVSDNREKTTVETRLEAGERELEQTRTRLREAEGLLTAGAVAPTAAVQPGGSAPEPAAAEAAPTPAEAPTPEPVPAEAAAPAAAAASFWSFDATLDSTAETPLDNTGEFAPAEKASPAKPAQPPVSDTATQPYAPGDLESTLPPVPLVPPPVAPPVAPPAGPPTADGHNRPGFALQEVQIAQKYFNDSQFTNRIRDVRKSLGKPKANLSKLVGAEPRAVLTIAWDIIWYQYLIDLRRDIPTDQRVSLHREGMDLDELTAAFKEKNSSVDDEGRLDASELEVKLLSDPSTLITEMSVEEEQALEDATEEIWDQKTAPEFKWDS